MKKWIAMLMALMMLISLAACGGTPASDKPADSGAVSNTGGGSDAGSDSGKEAKTLLVGLSIRGLDNPYYVELVEGVDRKSVV